MKFPINVSVLIISLFLIAISVNADDKKSNEHTTAHSASEDLGMVLNNGKKWETDAPLRKGMQTIRVAMKKAEESFQSKTMTPKEGKELGSQINKQLMYMVENCELQPKADASLHVVIGEMMQGIGELSKAPNSEGGFPRIHKALKEYPKFFDHPELN